MFPITESALSFREISDYWSREIHPPASSRELLHLLAAAWWLGELRGSSVQSPFQLLKKMFVSMRNQNDLGIVFIVGDDEGPVPVAFPDGSVGIDARPRIPVPSEDPDSWNEITCRDAFSAMARADKYPHLEVGLAWIELSYEEFTGWLSKRRYAKPTFWRPAVTKDVYSGPVARKTRASASALRKVVDEYVAQMEASGQQPTQTGLVEYARTVGVRGERQYFRDTINQLSGDSRRLGRPPARNPPKIKSPKNNRGEFAIFDGDLLRAQLSHHATNSMR
jgi:hypothetical protein